MKNLQDYLTEEYIDESKLKDIYTNINSYIEQQKILDKIKNISSIILKKCGRAMLYNVFILYYILIDKNTLLKDKLIILSTILYVITPLDAILDTTVLGLTDDVALITYTLNLLEKYNTDKIKELANKKCDEILKDNK